MKRVGFGLVLAGAALVAVTGGCTPAPPPVPPPPSPEPSDAEDRYAPPTAAPTAQEFGFDEAARFDDGVQIQLQSLTAGTATAQMSGAEGTGGQIVTATVEVINDGTRSVDLANWLVQGYYSEANVGAPLIADAAGTVGDSFDGQVGPGQTVTAAFAFAIPAEEHEHISVVVDRRDDRNEAVQFTGPVS